ncbi:uncharacterized protein MELLADRAFT_104572 [Melampsora larici-populina 98AG31]|uniref:Helicase ATP-binding domain-containing protein n=1 Tax=Melampsora larici-populina (strain 98AG31 / pathotype 3-4-7) TaxID=747676 RepID=F4RF59_MELLP|nr:uncharacterized protein MELLADRAFT_104572 [Melampsora larici-populina 98AG31]EGG08757.1 hypothetical protein MELLADRAFT_104572 [Melampsora larici-populina 98AG31]
MCPRARCTLSTNKICPHMGSHQPGLYKSKPAGGWNPQFLPHHERSTFLCSSVTTVNESGNIHLEVTTLIFIKQWEQEPFKHIVEQYHISIETPQSYNPQDHFHISLAPLRHSRMPKWKAAYPTLIHISAEDLAKLKAIPSGSDLTPVNQVKAVTSQLRRHQQQGLGFLLDRGDPHNAAFTSLWTSKSSAHFTVWTNLLCGESFIATDQQPAPASPGALILANDMGLGKSIQTIALIAHTLDAAKTYKNSYNIQNPNSQLRGSHTTLLICLKGLMDNWEREIEVHTRGLKLMRWHDTKRSTCTSDKEWHSANIIIITLGTLQHDDAASLIYNTKWYRIVIDEAHTKMRQKTILKSYDQMRQ